MKTFFTSDPHFGHVRIIDLCDRPFKTLDQMNETIIDNINDTVGSENRLVILGDIVMGKLDENLELLSRIEAVELILIPGNHDRWSSAYRHKGTSEEQKLKRRAAAQRYEDTRPSTWAVTDCTPSAWAISEFLPDYDEDSPLRRAWFSHYPYEGDSHGEDRHANLRVERGYMRAKGWPIIHGHVHEEWKIKDDQFNVGVDVNDFRPVHEDEIAEWILS